MPLYTDGRFLVMDRMYHKIVVPRRDLATGEIKLEEQSLTLDDFAERMGLTRHPQGMYAGQENRYRVPSRRWMHKMLMYGVLPATDEQIEVWIHAKDRMGTYNLYAEPFPAHLWKDDGSVDDLLSGTANGIVSEEDETEEA